MPINHQRTTINGFKRVQYWYNFAIFAMLKIMANRYYNAVFALTYVGTHALPDF